MAVEIFGLPETFEKRRVVPADPRRVAQLRGYTKKQLFSLLHQHQNDGGCVMYRNRLYELKMYRPGGVLTAPEYTLFWRDCAVAVDESLLQELVVLNGADRFNPR